MHIIFNLTFIGAIFGAIYYPMRCEQEKSFLKRILLGTIAFGAAGAILGIFITLVIVLDALLGSVMQGAIIGAFAGIIIGIKRYDLQAGKVNKIIANLMLAVFAGAILGTVVGIIIGLYPIGMSFWT